MEKKKKKKIARRALFFLFSLDQTSELKAEPFSWGAGDGMVPEMLYKSDWCSRGMQSGG